MSGTKNLPTSGESGLSTFSDLFDDAPENNDTSLADKEVPGEQEEEDDEDGDEDEDEGDGESTGQPAFRNVDSTNPNLLPPCLDPEDLQVILPVAGAGPQVARMAKHLEALREIDAVYYSTDWPMNSDNRQDNLQVFGI